ncbi:hypothetical protein IFM89_006726 [Coptis chinensis]|uniref:Myb/SANT-like domain-containing protein n=1 Tax=Coptis chinensis TaxID=261450 RepID=A0A835HTM4_9MAGN|nr:hypothetical protein IFM89_006726 [Coptis chinensis]
MDAALTEAFLDAYGQNKKHGRVWDEAMYTSIQLPVLAKTQEQVEKAHITSRMCTMRKEYNSFTNLASRSGFGWDPIKQTITVPPSSWIELLADPEGEGFTKRYLRKAYTILMRNPIEKEIFLGGDLELKQEMVEELRDLIGDI